MKISADVLRRFVSTPEDGRELRLLLDDVGIEVKRHDTAADTFTVELLANRGDHHSYLGLAREISGRTGGGVCAPEVPTLEVGPTPHPLALKTDLCGRYSLTLLERGEHAEGLSVDELAPLTAAEIHSVSAPVDATNIANIEFGQPTHCFDADTIVGPICIRLAQAGEMAWPLFSEGRVPVPEGAVVIADDEKILAIAGVIGCEESKTTDQTTRILLESAAFDPVAVRKASRALGIHTDSSARFERGSDPSQVLVGAGRVVGLLEHHGWSRRGPTGMVGAWKDERRAIPISEEDAGAFLGLELSGDDVEARLRRYGFEVFPAIDCMMVVVPPHRVWDVEFPADIYEELAKSIGYNAIPSTLPPVDMGALPTSADVVKARVEDVLLGAGFYEVFTNGFYGTSTRERLGVGEGHPLWPHVQTTNALDRGYGLVKNNCLAQAVEAVANNVRVGIRPLQMYEWTRTFHPDPAAANGVCREVHRLWAMAEGDTEPGRWMGQSRRASPWLMKGLIEELATTLRIPLEVGPADTDHPLSDCLHPGRQARITLNGETVGVLGEVHPRVTKAFKLKRTRPIYVEINREALMAPPVSHRYQERSVHQPIRRALAFSLPPGLSAGSVIEVMRASAPSWLDRVDIVDLFEHEEDGIPMRAVTFSLRYSNDDGTRSAESVNQTSEALIAAVTEQLGDRGVRLRA